MNFLKLGSVLVGLSWGGRCRRIFLESQIAVFEVKVSLGPMTNPYVKFSLVLCVCVLKMCSECGWMLEEVSFYS